MKEWRIALVNARIPKDADPQEAKRLSDVLTVSVLRSIHISDPEAWWELKALIVKAEKD